MAGLRMVLVHYEGDSARAAADLLRMALQGWDGVEEAVTSEPPAPASVASPIPAADDDAVHLATHADDPLPTPRRNARAKAAPPPVAKPPAVEVPTDGIKGQILTALRKRPMSSIELQEHLKLEGSQIYTPCSALKNAGLIENVADEGDGTRRYRLVEKGA